MAETTDDDRAKAEVADRNRKAELDNALHAHDAAVAEVDDLKEQLKDAKKAEEAAQDHVNGCAREVCNPRPNLYDGVGAAPEQDDDGDNSTPLPDPLACQICKVPLDIPEELTLCDSCNKWMCDDCNSGQGIECGLCKKCLKELMAEEPPTGASTAKADEATTAEDD